MDRLGRATVLVAVALWSLAGRAATPQDAPPAPVSAPAADAGAEVVFRALSLLGVNYRFGGNTPDSGLDCSGLVRLVFHDTLGLPLPRRSEEISRVGGTIHATELQPGDLVFFNTLRRAFSHVGIYIGNNQFVHAPSTGGQIRVESMGSDYWTRRFDGARRLLTSDLVASARATGAMPGDRLAISLPALTGSVLADGGAPRDLLATVRALDAATRSSGSAEPAVRGTTPGASSPSPGFAASTPAAGGSVAHLAMADLGPVGATVIPSTMPVQPVSSAGAAEPAATRARPVEPPRAGKSAAPSRPSARRGTGASHAVKVAARATPAKNAGPQQRVASLYVN